MSLVRWLGLGASEFSPLAWILGLTTAVAYSAASMTSLPFIRKHLLDRHPLKLLTIPFALVTGLFEEIFFRKWIIDWLTSHGWPIVAQIAVSGLAFGAAHAFWGLLGQNLRAAVQSMAFTTVLGCALAIVYLAAGRQLAPAVWAHVLINLVIEPWLMIGVVNLRSQRQPSLEVA